MPLLPFTYAPITQRVADRTFNASVFGQVATWTGITVRVVAGELRLDLDFDVVCHGLMADGTLGAVVPTGKGFIPWGQTLYANNDCAVYLNPTFVATATQTQDPRNGEILYYATLNANGAGWETRNADGTSTVLVGGLAAAPEPCIKQGDAFALSMDNPLALSQLIKYHLNAANQAPFLKFS